MIKMSKLWKMVSAVGYGVLFALALTGAVRIGFWLAGGELPQSVAGNLFLVTSAVAGSLSAFFYGRYVKAMEQQCSPGSQPSSQS